MGLAERALSGDTYKFSLGPLISWQFPNRGRVRARIAAANAESDAAFARFDGTVLNALRETESALTVYARDLDRTAALRDADAQAAKAARDAETLFRAGRTGFLPVLDAQRTAITAEQALAAAESRLSPTRCSCSSRWVAAAGLRSLATRRPCPCRPRRSGGHCRGNIFNASPDRACRSAGGPLSISIMVRRERSADGMATSSVTAGYSPRRQTSLLWFDITVAPLSFQRGTYALQPDREGAVVIVGAAMD